MRADFNDLLLLLLKSKSYSILEVTEESQEAFPMPPARAPNQRLQDRALLLQTNDARPPQQF